MTPESDVSGLVSFLQLSSVLLPQISISTVRSRARSIGVFTTPCDEDQLQLLRNNGIVHEHTSRAGLLHILEAQRLVASFARLFNPAALVVLKESEKETKKAATNKKKYHSVSSDCCMPFNVNNILYVNAYILFRFFLDFG